MNKIIFLLINSKFTIVRKKIMPMQSHECLTDWQRSKLADEDVLLVSTHVQSMLLRMKVILYCVPWVGHCVYFIV